MAQSKTKSKPRRKSKSTRSTRTGSGGLDSIVIGSVADFVAALSSRPADEIVWYRGHTDVAHQLVPSLARPPRSIDAELTLIKRFKQNAFPFLKSVPASEWDWLFLMQHHGVPTRLLDWSDSPLIALWFAMVPDDNDNDACVWALRPAELNLMANLAPEYAHDIPLFGQDVELDNYLPNSLINTMAKNTPAAGIASRQFSRVVAQMGSFTITHRDQLPLQDVAAKCLTQYVVPAGSKEKVRRELRYLRITRLSVFPELTNVAELAEEGLWQ